MTRYRLVPILPLVLVVLIAGVVTRRASSKESATGCATGHRMPCPLTRLNCNRSYSSPAFTRIPALGTESAQPQHDRSWRYSATATGQRVFTSFHGRHHFLRNLNIEQNAVPQTRCGTWQSPYSPTSRNGIVSSIVCLLLHCLRERPDPDAVPPG